jgi:hypothetical protein
MEEKIINIVTGMAEDGITTPTNWICVFTDKRAIFLEISTHKIVEFLSPLANRVASSYEVKDVADLFKSMSVDQILNSSFKNAIFVPDNLKDIRVTERPASFFRSSVTFPFEDKSVKLKMYKDTIRSVKDSLQKLSPNNSNFRTLPLHSVNYQKNISYGIRVAGLLIFLWSLWGMMNKIGVEEIFLAVAGLLIFFKRKTGAYILGLTIIIDLLLMQLFASGIDIEVLLRDIILLVVLAGVLAFLWKFREQLKNP